MYQLSDEEQAPKRLFTGNALKPFFTLYGFRKSMFANTRKQVRERVHNFAQCEYAR